jgi:hypothetical protein
MGKKKQTTTVEVSPIPPELKGTVDEISAYINNILDKKFPTALSGDIRSILSEIILDVYIDVLQSKCEKCEYMKESPSLIIQP